MRVRFEVVSLSQLSIDPQRVPINCWRMTLVFRVEPNDFVDGVPLGILTDPATGIGQPFTVVIGGVFDQTGNPVMIDQMLDLRLNKGGLVIFYEFIEP